MRRSHTPNSSIPVGMNLPSHSMKITCSEESKTTSRNHHGNYTRTHTHTHTHTCILQVGKFVDIYLLFYSYFFKRVSVDDDMDDEHVKQLVIITQSPGATPVTAKKHPGGDRTASHTTRAKLSVNISQAINDGLYFYEQVGQHIVI